MILAEACGSRTQTTYFPKSLNPLLRLIRFRSNWGQSLSDPVDSLALTFSNNVAVNLERDAWIRVAHLRLSDLRRRSQLKQHARVEVSECMETATRDFKSVE
jgi:hypothetical protein